MLGPIKTIYFFKSRSGIGLADALIGSLIVATALLAMSPLILQRGLGGLKARIIGTQTSIESGIIAALSDETQVANVKTQLSAGLTPTGWILRENGQNLAQIGTALLFDVSGKPCAVLDGKSCVIKSEIDVKCVPGVTYPMCSAAYRISVPSFKGVPEIAALGAPGKTGFSATDYNLVIDFDLYYKATSSNCGAGSLAVIGFNRDTGQINCANYPQTPCPLNTIAKSIFLSSTGSLEFSCAPVQTFKCPANYSLQSVSPASLEMGQTLQGTCVFIGKNPVPFRTVPPPAPSINGSFCPQFYNITNASCVVTVTSQTNGQCPQNCVPGPVDALGNATWNCTTPSPNPPSNVGDKIFSLSRNTATCAINVGPQTCGASWDGYVTFTGNCTLNIPETLPATAGP